MKERGIPAAWSLFGPRPFLKPGPSTCTSFWSSESILVNVLLAEVPVWHSLPGALIHTPRKSKCPSFFLVFFVGLILLLRWEVNRSGSSEGPPHPVLGGCEGGYGWRKQRAGVLPTLTVSPPTQTPPRQAR